MDVFLRHSVECVGLWEHPGTYHTLVHRMYPDNQRVRRSSESLRNTTRCLAQSDSSSILPAARSVDWDKGMHCHELHTATTLAAYTH